MKWHIIKRMGCIYINGKMSEELLMICDNCNKTVTKGVCEEIYNYCPHCGTKMEKE